MGCGSSAGGAKDGKYVVNEADTAVDEIKRQMAVTKEMDEARLVFKATRKMLGEASPSPSPLPPESPSKSVFGAFGRRMTKSRTTDSLASNTSLASIDEASPAPGPTILRVPSFARSYKRESQELNTSLRDSLSSSPNRRSFKDRKQFVLEELNAGDSTIDDCRGPPQSYKDLRNNSEVALGL
jgi:hypothetical protein